MARIDESGVGFLRRWLAGKPPPPPPACASDGLQAFHEGRHSDAERILVAAVDRLQRQQPDSLAAARALFDLGEVYRGQARFGEAEPVLKRAVALLERVQGIAHASLVRPLNSLALVYRAQGQYAQAEPLAKRAFSIAEGAHGPEDPALASVIGNLLAIYLAQGRYGEAEPLFRRSVTLKERALGPEHPALAFSLNNYAALLRRTQKQDEAAAWEARARAIGGARTGQE
jgi:tetratricopeptide (TPR) repeat protein